MAITILGISPGTRFIGIAVIRRNELIEWNVQNFFGPWTKEKFTMIIESVAALCEYYAITHVALKVTSPFHSSPHLNEVMQGINTITRRRKLPLTHYTLEDLKCCSSTQWKHTKEELMEFIAEEYPILRKKYLKERNNQRPYYLGMFEAIATARLLNQEIKQL